jgi:hypothetical protein
MTNTPMPAAQLIRDCPHKQASVSWPIPVDMRLDELFEQADAAGENTSRRELAAAIVARTSLTDAQLGKLLRWYRTLKVGELLTVPEGENVVPFVKHKPGPRKTGGSQD